MSLARQFFNELRPLVRMLEEPFGRHSGGYISARPLLLNNDFFGLPTSSSGPSALFRPTIDVTEHGNEYVLEAELPGVKKENLEVRIGDGGRSVTIEGKVISRGGGSEALLQERQLEDVKPGSGTTGVTEASNQNQVSAETRPTYTRSSAFTRTVWLPRPVDGANVSAKLQDGILSLTIPKAEDKASLKVPVE